jgi:hypothetical protein
MNKIVLIFFLCLITQSVFAQIPNAGFENWTGGAPDGWVTSNITGFTNVTQSGTSHSGSNAVRGEVITLFPGYVLQPVLQTGQGARGFAYSDIPTSIRGYYQFYPVGGDRFAVNVGLFKGGIGGTHVGVAAIADPTATSSYTQFTATFFYQTPDMPDTCVIQFQIIGPYLGPDTIPPPHAGSYFLIDDLNFGPMDVENPNTVQPERFLLSQNYPNPFNPGTSIPFSISKGMQVKLRVFNILGGEVATLVNGWRSAGKYYEKFDASKFASGVYFYRLDAGNYSATKQMLLIK